MTEKYAYYSMSNNDEQSAVSNVVYKAAKRSGIRVWMLDEKENDLPVQEAEINAIRAASLVIADVSKEASNVMLDIGYAQALGKPIILMANKSRSVPFSFAGYPVIIYGEDFMLDFFQRMEENIKRALSNPDEFILGNMASNSGKRTRVFLSYSRHDKDYLDRLLVHLKPLERDGLIDLWVDARLQAGDRWKKEITVALDRATVAILLVSADFLASDFVINNELPPLLRNAADKGTRIIPLIVKPCRFLRHDELKHFHAVNDPSQALILLNEGEKELQYDAVASEVEKALSKG